MASNQQNMTVIKRSGKSVPVDIGRIQVRLTKLIKDVEAIRGRRMKINVFMVASQVIMRLRDNISTTEIDRESAAVMAAMTGVHTDYSLVAGALLASNHQRENKDHREWRKFVARATGLDHPVKQGETVNLLSDDVIRIVNERADEIDARMVYDRDLLYDYPGFLKLSNKTSAYLLTHFTSNGDATVIETPQHMHMGIAIALTWKDDPTLEAAFELYDQLSLHKGTMATPTTMYARTPHHSLISCYLATIDEDSLRGITRSYAEVADYSKNAGGVGLAMHTLRANGSYIRGTNGRSNGLRPVARVLNMISEQVDQGGGKRPGRFAIYMSLYHADVFEVLESVMRESNHSIRTPNLFMGLWTSDLFMKRLKKAFFLRASGSSEKVMWSLLDPADYKGRVIKEWRPEHDLYRDALERIRGMRAELGDSEEMNDLIEQMEGTLSYGDEYHAGLHDLWGDEFESEYERLESEGRYVRQVDILELWERVTTARCQSGRPYILFKDSANEGNPQENLGALTMSNLCAEILLRASRSETACCNLASIAVNKFIVGGELDQAGLSKTVKIFVRALNAVIDLHKYATQKSRRSNKSHRPIAIGIQGLSDAVSLANRAYDQEDGRELGARIAEEFYYSACEASHEYALDHGSYASFEGSPMHKGKFQFDLRKDHSARTGWLEHSKMEPVKLTKDWDSLRAKCKTAMANSALVAYMPTASTSTIMGNSPGIEMRLSQTTKLSNNAGEFTIISSALVNRLTDEGLWCTEMSERIREEQSIKGIKEIPESIRRCFPTNRDTSCKATILMNAAMCQFVDHTSSMNLTFEANDRRPINMTKAAIYAWELGLKTGCYYAKSFTVEDQDNIFHRRGKRSGMSERELSERMACSIKNQEECTMCSA